MRNIQDLKTRGLVSIPYPIEIRPVIERSIKSWIDFCTLDVGIKNKFTYIDDIGFEIKEEKGETKDLKENFHVRISGLSRLQAIAREVNANESFEFIESVEELANAIEPTVLDFAEELGREFGIENARQEVLDNKLNWTVRFLHYFGDRNDGDVTASPHIDKGAYTLHLFETDKGLEYLDKETRRWLDMPVGKDETVIITGSRMQNLSKNNIKALCHRVVANKNTKTIGRYSAVLFVNFEHSPLFNKDKFGRLQEFPPGFNYDMPFEEFGKMFTLDRGTNH